MLQIATRYNYVHLPIALGDISLVAVAMTVTLNDVNSDSPVSTSVAVSTPSDSSAEYLCSLNPTQATKIEPRQLVKHNYNTILCVCLSVTVCACVCVCMCVCAYILYICVSAVGTTHVDCVDKCCATYYHCTDG